MARAKRKSTVLERARQQLGGIKTITPPADFGPNLLVADYEKEINDFSAKIDRHNGMLATSDDLQNELETDESKLRDRTARMLAAAQARYGRDSSEYELAGGTRHSERKRGTRKGASIT